MLRRRATSLAAVVARACVPGLGNTGVRIGTQTAHEGGYGDALWKHGEGASHGEAARRTQWVRRRQAWVCCPQAAGSAWDKVQGHGGAQCLSASSLWDHVLPHPVHSGLMSSSRKADSHTLPSRSDPPPPLHPPRASQPPRGLRSCPMIPACPVCPHLPTKRPAPWAPRR